MKSKLFFVLLAGSLFLTTGDFAMRTNTGSLSGLTARSRAEKRYNIAEHGAVGDGTTLNSKAIQAVVDDCAKNGGGTVVIPKGIFLTGSIFLKQGVNIEFLEGGVLRGSQDINDYPKMMTRIEGHFEPWRCALLNGENLEHLRITGPGTLDGNGQPFWKEFYDRRSADPKTTNLNVERPRLTFLRSCNDVKITGMTYLNSGFWNLHLYRCGNVTVEKCRFQAPSGRIPDHAPSSDGIDIDSSHDITVSQCFFSVGDDDIALKGSKGPFAMQDKDSPPVEHIKILDCIFEQGGGIVTCGSEATFVRDVEIQRCITRGPVVLRLKLRPDTPQQYENIRLNDITMEGSATLFAVAPWTQYFDLKGEAPPTSIVRNISVSNIHGTGGSFGSIKGNPGTSISDIRVKDVDVKFRTADFPIGALTALTFKNVKVNGEEVNAPVPKEAAPAVKP